MSQFYIYYIYVKNNVNLEKNKIKAQIFDKIYYNLADTMPGRNLRALK